MTDESAHVFDKAQNGEIRLPEHLHSATDILDGDLRRCRDDEGACKRRGLGQTDLNVTGARRKIDYEDVELAPVDLKEELVHHFCQHRTAPDHRDTLIDQHSHGDHLQTKRLRGLQAPGFFICPRLAVKAEHPRDVRAVYIGVHETDAASLRGHGDGEIGTDRRFADTALAAGYGQHIFNAGNRLAVMSLHLSHRATQYPEGSAARQARRLRRLTMPAAAALTLSCTNVAQIQRDYEAGDDAKLDKLIEIAGRQDYPYATRKKAVIALGESSDSLAVPVLVGVLREYERRTTLQEQAIIALGKIGDRTAVESIGHLLDRTVMDSGMAELRMAAWPVLGDLGGEEAAGILVNALSFFDRLRLLEDQRSGRGVFSGDEQRLRAWRDSLRSSPEVNGGRGGLFGEQSYAAVSMFGTPIDELDWPPADSTAKERQLVYASLVRVGQEAVPVIRDHLSKREATVTLRAELAGIIEEIREPPKKTPQDS